LITLDGQKRALVQKTFRNTDSKTQRIIGQKQERAPYRDILPMTELHWRSSTLPKMLDSDPHQPAFGLCKGKGLSEVK
jgi:hypothetical protein